MLEDKSYEKKKTAVKKGIEKSKGRELWFLNEAVRIGQFNRSHLSKRTEWSETENHALIWRKGFPVEG